MRKTYSDTNNSHRDFIKVQKEYSQRSRTNGLIPPFLSDFESMKMMDIAYKKEEISELHKKQHDLLPEKAKEIITMCRNVSRDLKNFKDSLKEKFQSSHNIPERDEFLRHQGEYLKSNGKTEIGLRRSQQIHDELKSMATEYFHKRVKKPTRKFPQAKKIPYEGENLVEYYIIHSYMKKCIKLTYRIYYAYIGLKRRKTENEREFRKAYQESKKLSNELKPKHEDKPEHENKEPKMRKPKRKDEEPKKRKPRRGKRRLPRKAKKGKSTP